MDFLCDFLLIRILHHLFYCLTYATVEKCKFSLFLKFPKIPIFAKYVQILFEKCLNKKFVLFPEK